MRELVAMPKFHELLDQLASEYERAQNALANALAELRTYQEQDVPEGTFTSRIALGPPHPLRASSFGALPLPTVQEECGAWDGRDWHTDQFQDSVDDKEGHMNGAKKEQAEVCDPATRPTSPTPAKSVTFGAEMMEEPSLDSCRGATLQKPEIVAIKSARRQDTWQTYMATRASTERTRRLSVEGLMELLMPIIGRRRARGARWVINPENSPALEKWDYVTIMALAYVAVVTPVQVSMLESKMDAMLVFNCFIDLIFFCDMILQFFLMYPRRSSGVTSFEGRHSEIVLHYLRTWFTIDLFATLPFDLLAALSDSQEAQQLKLVKAIRLMRLLKLLRMVKASRVFNRFETRCAITYGKLALLKFFVILFVITHWLANLWALTLVIVDENEGLPRWVDALTALEDNVAVKTKDSPAKLYVACLYFTSYTITSVGYGDIGPKNIVERIVLIVIIIGSGISWAVVLGEVCGIISNLNKDESTFRTTMDELNAMMRDRVIPRSIRMRLRSFFLQNQLAQKRLRQRHIVLAMSPGLRAEVSWEINRGWLEKISFLRPLVEEAERDHATGKVLTSMRPFVLDMSMVMEQVGCAQTEVFGVLHKMYILNRGLVGRLGRLFRSGAVWGADFVLSDEALLEPVHSCALTYIEFMTIDREHFFEIVQRHAQSFPQIYATIRRYCCWLAFQRALMVEARRRRSLRDQTHALHVLPENEGYDVPDDERQRR